VIILGFILWITSFVLNIFLILLYLTMDFKSFYNFAVDQYPTVLHFVCYHDALTELHSNIESLDKSKPRMFILVSSVMTWARSKPLDPVRYFFVTATLAVSCYYHYYYHEIIHKVHIKKFIIKVYIVLTSIVTCDPHCYINDFGREIATQKRKNIMFRHEQF